MLQLLSDSAWQVSCLELCAALSISHQAFTPEREHIHSTDIYWAFIMEARDDVEYSNSLTMKVRQEGMSE